MNPLLRAYRRLRHGEAVVVVSGLPRSGTSMAMKMLEAGGMELLTDGRREADEDNPKGYYELERVKHLGEDPDKSWLREGRGKAVKVISYLLKDLPRDNNYKVIFMVRDLDEVLASQKKMLERRGEPQGADDEKMKDLFLDHLVKTRRMMRRAPHLEVLELRYRDVLAEPEAHARRIRAFLGRALDVKKMAEAVDPDLYRNRRRRGAAKAGGGLP